MATFGQRLKQLRNDNGLKQKELINELSNKYGRKLSVSMLSKWENDKEEPQKFSDVTMLAKYFGVSGSYLMGESDRKYGEDRRSVELPVIDIINDGTEIINHQDELHDVVKATDEVDLCIRAYDDSMIGARICKGDHLFIRKQRNINDREIAYIFYEKKMLIRRINYIDNGMLLMPENPAFQPILIPDKSKKDYFIYGKVIFFKSEVK